MNQFITCPHCGGEGSHEVPRPFWDDPYYCEVIKCDDCNGSGWAEGSANPITPEDLEMDSDERETDDPREAQRKIDDARASRRWAEQVEKDDREAARNYKKALKWRQELYAAVHRQPF